MKKILISSLFLIFTQITFAEDTVIFRGNSSITFSADIKIIDINRFDLVATRSRNNKGNFKWWRLPYRILSIKNSVTNKEKIISIIATLPMDACVPRNRYFYLIKTVGTILKITKLPFLGTKASSIKPISAGRFYPNPILLMSVPNMTEPLSILIFNWRRDQLMKVRVINITDFIWYKGLNLARTQISKYLTGIGNATFQFASTTQSYSVCFNLKRQRQRVFGYPE
jgi:hypothetical protein